jgi:hypothetical protein
MADYLSPAAILAEETLFPATVVYGASGLGRDLDPSCSTSDLPEGAEVELPLWLAQVLADRRMVRIGLPFAYSERCVGRRRRRRRRLAPPRARRSSAQTASAAAAGRCRRLLHARSPPPPFLSAIAASGKSCPPAPMR